MPMALTLITSTGTGQTIALIPEVGGNPTMATDLSGFCTGS